MGLVNQSALSKPSGGGAVSSVTSTDPSVVVTPTTGTVVIYMFNPMFYTYFGGF